MSTSALRERLTELKASLARPAERAELAVMRQTEAALREEERIEQDATARDMARRAAEFTPEIARAKATTMRAIHAFAAAFDAEKLVRERAHAAGLYELGYWSVAPISAAPLLRVSAEQENR